MTTYRFIKTINGQQVCNDPAGADILIDCFRPCSDEVRAQLADFLESGRAVIVFEFEQVNEKVEVIRK